MQDIGFRSFNRFSDILQRSKLSIMVLKTRLKPWKPFNSQPLYMCINILTYIWIYGKSLTVCEQYWPKVLWGSEQNNFFMSFFFAHNFIIQRSMPKKNEWAKKERSSTSVEFWYFLHDLEEMFSKQNVFFLWRLNSAFQLHKPACPVPPPRISFI